MLTAKYFVKKPLMSVALLAIAAVGFVSRPASAHVLVVDGDIAVVLHVNPDDNPTSGAPTSYILYFTDSSGRFAMSKCNCEATLQESGRSIATQQLADSDPLQSDDPVTFPKPDVYTLIVSGQPKQAKDFQPFSVRYLLRVTQGDTTAQPIPPLVWVGLGFVMAFAVVAGISQQHAYNKNKRKN